MLITPNLTVILLVRVGTEKCKKKKKQLNVKITHRSFNNCPQNRRQGFLQTQRLDFQGFFLLMHRIELRNAN